MRFTNPVPTAARTMVQRVFELARERPHAIAYRFLCDPEAGAVETLTYSELCSGMARAAACISQYAKPGDRAVILHPPGLNYILWLYGCLYAGIVAVPAYPVRNSHHAHRLLALVKDARASLLLAAPQDEQRIQSSTMPLFAAQAPVLCCTDIRDFQQQCVVNAVDAAHTAHAEHGLAFLQYTSGSTGSPKGVMVSHANVMNNVHLIWQRFGHDAQARTVSWLPPYHDMGLISAIFEPVYGGFPATLMAPIDFLQQPFQWLRWVTLEKATTTGGPNFAFDLCCKRITDAELETLDLSSLQIMFNGAEPVRRATLENFTRRFARTGFRMRMFYPCYGMAETTLFALGGLRDQDPVWCERNDASAEADPQPTEHWVGCGQPVEGHTILVVDPLSQRVCLDGQEGEIWVQGPSVAQGYWDKPSDTRDSFHARLQDGTGPFLRTGDLGFCRQGEFFITGRKKDLIIVRGQNYYPQDLERVVEENVAEIKHASCIAFEYREHDETRIAIVAEIERAARKTPSTEILESVRRAILSRFSLPLGAIVLVPPGKTFKTSSGKIQRSLARESFTLRTLDVWSAWPEDLGQEFSLRQAATVT